MCVYLKSRRKTSRNAGTGLRRMLARQGCEPRALRKGGKGRKLPVLIKAAR